MTRPLSPPTAPVNDPVTVEVYRHLFASIADEMGEVLRRTACSPNIKERRDYSSAVFDGTGRMIAQGENIPVHLGSMPASVAAAIADIDPGPGDVVILNDPYRGGTHLPDVTLVAPFVSGPGRPIFYVANRAHHADIGGSSPGSLPLARELLQEGLVLPPVLWTRAGQPVAETRRILLANVRTPEENTGDLAAQEAALGAGLGRLSDLVASRGLEEPLACAGELLARAGRAMTSLLAALPRGTWTFTDVIEDDGLGSGPLPLRVRLTLDGERARVDFTGSAGPAASGMNAVPAIVHSAVRYVFRCLLPPDAPANDGCWEPIDVIVPPNSILDPPRGCAVAAGNVETSQRLVDVLLGALAQALPERIPAASQGTMNNVALGGVRSDGRPFTYYETLAGGHGARPDGPGISARHSHMTNSLNTPIEALERDLPLRVERCTIRRDSGGAGLHRGGDGIVRALRLLVPAEVTVLSERRSIAPWGLAGGEQGSPGRNRLRRAAAPDRVEDLPAKFSLRLAAGDVLEIETPGGGGCGPAGGRG